MYNNNQSIDVIIIISSRHLLYSMVLLSKEYAQVKIIDENSLKISRRSLEAINRIRTKDAMPKEKNTK